jgi:hypothetical protein
MGHLRRCSISQACDEMDVDESHHGLSAMEMVKFLPRLGYPCSI